MSIQRKVVAGLLFLLAALISVHTVMYFYLERVNPTSTNVIRSNLKSPEVMSRFKVEEATKSGYSEDEIVKYLSEENARDTERIVKTFLLLEEASFAVAVLVGLGVIVLVTRSRGPST